MEFLHLWSIDLGREPAPRRRAAANEALRRILTAHLPAGTEVELVTGEHGKPRLAAGGPEFNLSHSGGIALVALSPRHPVGVDVEQVRPRHDPVALAERALSADDAEAVRRAAPAQRAVVFHRLWARHEARLKCLGEGILGGPPTGTLAVRDLEVGPGYAAAVAVAVAEMPPLRCWTFDPGALQKDGSRVS